MIGGIYYLAESAYSLLPSRPVTSCNQENMVTLSSGEECCSRAFEYNEMISRVTDETEKNEYLARAMISATKAHEQGFAAGQNLLGTLYFNNETRFKDAESQSYIYFSTAYNNPQSTKVDRMDTSFNLGCWYELFKKDKKLALKWFIEAEKYGHPQAAIAKSRVEKYL